MKLRRVFLFVPTVFILCFLLSACGEKTPLPSGTVDISSDTETPEERLGVPETADYGGETFRILTAGSVAYEDFTFDEESSLPLDSAQFKRKALVEQSYNVNIEQTVREVFSTSGGGAGFLQISTDVNAGDCNFDLALISGYDVSVLAYSNFLYDMNSIPGIDLSKSWWDQKANESLSVSGVMFFTTGEITVSDNDAAMAILFNKELHAQYNLENLYQMVYDGRWTLDQFAQLCKTVTEDMNQDSVMDQNDRYGLLVWIDSVLGVVNGSGQQCATVAEDGNIELTLYNETTVAALEQFFSLAFDTQYSLVYQRYVTSALPMWLNNQGLFWTVALEKLPQLREMETDFGILPFPKFSDTQTNYYTTVSPFNSQFICVPLIQDDVERTGVITEALAYYGKQIVTPAYYDVSLIGQSTRDEESAGMLDIIFDSLVFDLGFYYRVGTYNQQLINMTQRGDSNFTSMYDTYKNSAVNLLNVINEYYQAAVAEWQ